jgi:hypothetical protein
MAVTWKYGDEHTGSGATKLVIANNSTDWPKSRAL